MGGTISEISRSVFNPGMGRGGWSRKITPETISQHLCRSGAERGGLRTRFVLSSLPSSKTTRKRNTLFGRGGRSFLCGPRCLRRREPKSPAFIQWTSITLTRSPSSPDKTTVSLRNCPEQGWGKGRGEHLCTHRKFQKQFHFGFKGKGVSRSCPRCFRASQWAQHTLRVHTL